MCGEGSGLLSDLFFFLFFITRLCSHGGGKKAGRGKWVVDGCMCIFMYVCMLGLSGWDGID